MQNTATIHLTKCPNCHEAHEASNLVPLDGSYWVNLEDCGCLGYSGEWAREALADIVKDCR